MEELHVNPEPENPEQEQATAAPEAAEAVQTEPAAEEQVTAAVDGAPSQDQAAEAAAIVVAHEPGESQEQSDEQQENSAEQPEPSNSVSVDELMSAGPEQANASPEQPRVEDSQLRAVLEAIVYVAEEPLTLTQLASALGEPQERVRWLLNQLIEEFEKPEHGLAIREVAGGFKMTTKPEHHDAVRNFVKSLKPPLKLSLPALETLAVIAYKQPVTAPEIMEIRGVQGAGVLKTLIDRKLIATAGRKNVIGKPILYKTTKEFLIQFGLKDLSELPSLKEFEEIRRMAVGDMEPEAEPEPQPQPTTRPLPLVEAQPEDAGVNESSTDSAVQATAQAEPESAEPVIEPVEDQPESQSESVQE